MISFPLGWGRGDIVVANLRFRLSLLGSFRLLSPDGTRIGISSKKGMALIAMLATARDGERTRVWLQDNLWGKRRYLEAQGSLRRELLNLRKLLNRPLAELIVCRREKVSLNF
jgi:DNA-binding SARP family transcriptional activator